MAKAKLRVAIIGTGRMGGLMEDENPFTNQYSKPYAHFSSYQSIESTEVVAVANRGADRFLRLTLWERFPERCRSTFSTFG